LKKSSSPVSTAPVAGQYALPCQEGVIHMKTSTVLTLLVLTLAVMALPAIAGCSSSTGTDTQRGKLTAIGVTMSMDEVMGGQANDLQFNGKLTITTDNGENIEAYYTKDMADRLIGGQILEIKKIKDTDKWMVTRILKEPQ
jgi:hypothetical protein